MTRTETFPDAAAALQFFDPADVTGMHQAGEHCIIEITRTIHVRGSLIGVMRALAGAAVPAPGSFAQAPLAEPAATMHGTDDPAPERQVDTAPRSAEERLAEARASRPKHGVFHIKAEHRYATPAQSWTTQRREAAQFDNRLEATQALDEWFAGDRPPPAGTKVVEEV